MFLKLPQYPLILHIVRDRMPDARQVGCQTRQIILSNFRPKGGYALIWPDHQKEVFPTIDHGGQYCLYQRVVGIEQDVVGTKTVELEGNAPPRHRHYPITNGRN